MATSDDNYIVYGEVLARASIGSWKIEIDDGKPPRMWADTTMMQLLGVAGKTLSPEETYHAWYDHIDKDHYGAVKEGVDRMINGKHAEIQYPWHHPDGSVVIVRCGGVRDFEYEGGLRIAGIHQLVTELHHIEHGRKTSSKGADETLSAIVKQLYGFNMTVDLTDGTFSMITGTGSGETIALAQSVSHYRPFFDKMLTRVRPEFRDRCREMFSLDFMRNNCGKLGYFDTIEYAVDANGKTVWEESHLIFGINAEGHPVANCLGRDITAARRAQTRHEQELKAAAARNQLLSSITQSLYGFNVTVDLNTGTYSLITGTGTETICKMFQAYRDYHLAVEALLSRIRTDSKTSARKLIGRDYLMAQRNSSGHIGAGEFAWTHPGGAVNWLELNVFIGSDDEGAPVANILGRDVTERHTRAETDRQLLLAKQTSAAKTRFLSTMSHDIRTPMNSILGMTTIAQTYIRQCVEKGEGNQGCLKEIGYCMDNVLVATQHMLGLVNDIPDMSRIDSGRLSFAEKPFLLEEMEKYVTAIIRQQADAKGVSFTCRERNVSNRRLVGDMMRISQILINILGNSVKFTGSKGEIGLEIVERPGRTSDEVEVVLTCTDNGRGMSEEFLPHLYEPFSQEGRQYSDTYVGTGLGMSIVKQLVELMHGTIDVRSTLGKGTTFVVSLPLKIDATPAAPASDGASAREDGKALVARFRFLIVEDVAANAEVLSLLIRLSGGRSEVARNGAEGVEVFQKAHPGHFDCILMDVRMPIMNGYEATQAIRALPRLDAKTIPIIAMTADAFADDVKQALDAGMDAHLSKPISFQSFTETLAQVVAKPRIG